MNHEQRQNAIGTFLRERLLKRYVRPPHLDDDTARAELADMVDDLYAKWPAVNTEQEFNEVANRLHAELRQSYSGRVWPAIALLLKALDKARVRPQPEGSAHSNEETPVVYEVVSKHWRECRAPLPSTAKEHHAERLVADGLATWGELRWAGFPIPEEQVEEASRQNRHRHEAVLESIRAMQLDGPPRRTETQIAEDRRRPWHEEDPESPRFKTCSEALAKVRAQNPLMQP